MSIEVSLSRTRLVDARAQLRISQKRLAQAAGVAETTVIGAERGLLIRRISAHAILDALNAERIDRGMSPLGIHDLDWNVQQEK
jgi:DNA-binding XRE family transcriptional regulator